MKRILKRKETPATESADNGRRSFFWKLGAGVSTALGSTAVLAAPGGEGDSGDLSQQVAMLEEEKELRRLHQRFEHALDSDRHEEVVEMFTDDGVVVFGNERFSGRRDGVTHLIRDQFRARKTGKRMEPAPGFEPGDEELSDSVHVATDRMSATATFPYSIQVGEVFDTESSLASMARLHGEGVRTWWEGGVYKVSYRRAPGDNRWKIAVLEYRTLSRADYRPGRTYAKPLIDTSA